MCREAYDTLSVGFDACNSANVQLEAINKVLANDLEISKVLTQSCEAEKLAAEKQLKKKIRQNRLKEGLLWTVSGIAAACMVLYLVK